MHHLDYRIAETAKRLKAARAAAGKHGRTLRGAAAAGMAWTSILAFEKEDHARMRDVPVDLLLAWSWWWGITATEAVGGQKTGGEVPEGIGLPDPRIEKLLEKIRGDLQRERERAGMGQQQLADALKVDQAKVARVESGLYRMTLGYLLQVGKVLDIPPEQWLRGA